MPAKYSIEIKMSFDMTSSGRFKCADLFISEGNNFEEIVENASISLIDQDGGEAGEIDFGSIPLSQTAWITAEIYRQMQIQDLNLGLSGRESNEHGAPAAGVVTGNGHLN